MNEISIIVPAFNEQSIIFENISRIIEYCENNFDRFEIIVVDDGSTDLTCELVLKIDNKNVKILKNEINRGKGYSIKKGILTAQYHFVLFLDADLSTPIEELGKFINTIEEGFDIVISSRRLHDSNIVTSQTILRRFFGNNFKRLIKLFFLLDFSDYNCGFKLFKTNVAKDIVSRLTVNRYVFDVEILYIAVKTGFKIKELPVVWKNRRESRVHIFKDSFISFLELLKIFFNIIINRYR